MRPKTRRLAAGDKTFETQGRLLEINRTTGATAHTDVTTVWEDRGRRYARYPVVIVRVPGQHDQMMNYGTVEKDEAMARRLVLGNQ